MLREERSVRTVREESEEERGASPAYEMAFTYPLSRESRNTRVGGERCVDASSKRLWRGSHTGKGEENSAFRVFQRPFVRASRSS